MVLMGVCVCNQLKFKTQCGVEYMDFGVRSWQSGFNWC